MEEELDQDQRSVWDLIFEVDGLRFGVWGLRFGI